jgi:hypothetical protein
MPGPLGQLDRWDHADTDDHRPGVDYRAVGGHDALHAARIAYPEG